LGTDFTTVYNRFLGKITDDMYVELTPQDTIRDLRNMLIDAIPGFEFPRHNLYDYEIAQVIKNQDEVDEEDFVMGLVWDELETDELDDAPPVMVEHSKFAATLTSEEINILAILMMCSWLQRQVTSIENTRMKYSGSDFKMTSQANHLSKLLSLLNECHRQSHHMQRLYKRRKIGFDGSYQSNWSSLRETSALE
jgi:hypothetical protein